MTSEMLNTSTDAARALRKELHDLHKEPHEGFVVEWPENMFKWRVGIYGPPETIYQGGYFKAELSFPANYPLSPPSMRFLSPMWHPNIYKDGKVCISILHPPVNDEMSGELSKERWLPTQSVRTVLLSVISLLNEPNISSPANVDASVAYCKWKKAGVKDFETHVKGLVQKSREQADLEGISVPNTVEDYCVKPKPPVDDYEWGGEMDGYYEEEGGHNEALSTDSDDDGDEEEGGHNEALYTDSDDDGNEEEGGHDEALGTDSDDDGDEEEGGHDEALGTDSDDDGDEEEGGGHNEALSTDSDDDGDEEEGGGHNEALSTDSDEFIDWELKEEEEDYNSEAWSSGDSSEGASNGIE